MNFAEYQNELNFKWEQLDKKIQDDEEIKKSGEGQIQVSNEFWITLNVSNLPGLKIFCDKKLDIQKKNLPECKGWKLDIIDNQILMRLKNQKYSDFFKDTINLILARIYLQNINDKDSIIFFLERLDLAKNFFDSDDPPKPLTEFEQIGLFGEISLINDFFLKKMPYEECISIWTGPSKKHDFTTNKFLLEAKTTTQDKKIINVSSNQLSPIYDKNLYLSLICINKGINCENLNTLIESLSLKLNEIGENLLNEFLIKLRQSGYYDFHKEQYNQKYIIKNLIFYKIDDSFPHISSNIKIPEAISDVSVTYKIDLDKCEEFRINEDELLEKL